jgi:Sad1 / UNC-like C-terminal
MKNLRIAKPLPYAETLQTSLKDRFNYASFSCAALILSTSKDSRYTSAILNNNPDQYMLTKCPPPTHLLSLDLPSLYIDDDFMPSYKSQFKREKDYFSLLTSQFLEPLFVTIELCADIKIDTVVITNNEYFSSTFHHFSLWVSTYYPPKQSLTSKEDDFKSWQQELNEKYAQNFSEGILSKPIYKNGWKLIGFFEAANIRGPQVSYSYTYSA